MTESVAKPPTPEQIAIHAYLIWEHEGRPQGHDRAHWLQAQEQLLTNHHAVNAPTATPTGSASARRIKNGTARVKPLQEANR